MCDIWRANRELDEISARLISKHRQDFIDLEVRSVVLTGGEPLMHGNLWQICKMFKEIDIKITLLSSGLLLDQHAEEIVTWCDEVVIPIDGDAATHDRIRDVSRAFERMAEGVKALRSINQDQQIFAQSVLQRINYGYFADMIELALEMDLDGISFHAVDTDSTAYNRAQGWTRERVETTRLRLVDVMILRNVVDTVRGKYREQLESDFIRGGESALDDLVELLEYAAGLDDGNARQCNAPWHSVVIEATGKVRPCPFHKPYGTIRKNSLSEILNSDQSITFRDELNVSTNNICRSCTSRQVFGTGPGPENSS